MSTNFRFLKLAFVLGLYLSVFQFSDAYAQAGGALFDSGTNFLNALMDLLTNIWARIVAVIAVVILGFMLMFGRLDKRYALSVIGGIILVFGAAAIVDSVATNI